MNTIKYINRNKQNKILKFSIKIIDAFYLRFKKYAETPGNINDIKRLNLPKNVQSELIAKFNKDLEINRN